MPSRKNNAPKITAKSQAGQHVPDMTEDQAREHIEKLLWPNGPACRHCGSVDVYRMQGATVRPGLLQCRDCGKQFTVTVGTVLEDTHLPLSTWVKAFHYMCASKKGISALQLQRNLGLGSYRTAWHLAHRIRLAMKYEPVAGALKGEVQVDETYCGGKPRKGHGQPRPKRGRGTHKTPVLVLVETNGNARSHPVESVDGKTLKAAMEQHIAPSAAIVTDDLAAYPKAVANFTGGHYTVNHGRDEYVRTDGRHTNTAESFFALLKRGLVGTFHHVSKKHLHRYCDEFSHRWNGRALTDVQRRDGAMGMVEGKRLYYKQPAAPAVQ